MIGYDAIGWLIGCTFYIIWGQRTVWFRSGGWWQQLLWGLVSSRDFYPVTLVQGSTTSSSGCLRPVTPEPSCPGSDPSCGPEQVTLPLGASGSFLYNVNALGKWEVLQCRTPWEVQLFLFFQAGFTHFIQVVTRLGVASSIDLAVLCVVSLRPGWRAELS